MSGEPARASLRIGGDEARGDAFTFQFDGRAIRAYPGETVAVSLWAAGERRLRNSPGAGEPRGAFCFMGSCQECVVVTEAGAVEACRLPAAPGLVVSRMAYVHAD